MSCLPYNWPYRIHIDWYKWWPGCCTRVCNPECKTFHIRHFLWERPLPRPHRGLVGPQPLGHYSSNFPPLAHKLYCMSFHFLHRQVCTLWYISHRILQEEIWKKWFSISIRDKLTYLMELGELPKHKLKRVILVLSSSSCWLLVDYLEVDKWFIRKHWAGPGFLWLGPRFVEGNVVVSSSVD